jgi:hypothetical protein
MLLNIFGVDPNGFAVPVGRGKGNIVQHAFHHGLQAPGADILYGSRPCNSGNRSEGLAI